MSIRLGLRHNRHMVSVLKPPGWRRETLGAAYPDHINPRSRILEQWGIDGRSPRRQEMASIGIPLGKRTQAILSYQVDAGLRRHLTSGMGSLAGSRRDVAPGIRERVHLGPGGAVLPVDAGFSGRAAHVGRHR